MSALRLLGAAVAALLFASGAQADTLTFFSGGTGYTGAYSGGSSVYSILSTAPLTCATAGCSGDVVQGTLHYNVQPGTSVALDAIGVGGTTPTAFGDYSPNYGGLGAANSIDGNDQINGNNVLHLQFAQIVTITGLATLFHPDHADGGNFGGAGFTPALIKSNEGAYSFKFSEDGTFNDFGAVLFANANNANAGIAVTGKDFYFMQADNNPYFYVSGLTFTTASTGQQCTTGTCTPAVPIPGAVWLFGTALAGLGTLKLKRRRRQALSAA